MSTDTPTMPRFVERAVITATAVMGVATVVLLLLAIWNRDPRWAGTAGVAFFLVMLGLLALMIHAPSSRSRSR